MNLLWKQFCRDDRGQDLVEYELAAGMVAVAAVARPLQPSLATDPSTEVWVANGATQISVLNMSGQTVAANIPTPSIPSGATPTGIIFTNSGDTALEAFKLSSPDASGNLGVLAVFDAVNRVVSSALALKYSPAAMVMAPDGLTAYLLSTGGEITYCDILSGTADLSASTFTPGVNNGYNGVSKVFIHPGGTRFFWAVGPMWNRSI